MSDESPKRQKGGPGKMAEKTLCRWKKSIVTIGSGGRGFLVGSPDQGLVITAAHCLPHFPPVIGDLANSHERTYPKIVVSLDRKRRVWAECLFVDPVSDLAVLGEPDGQLLFEESEAYLELASHSEFMTIGALRKGETTAWMLSRDLEWFPCTVRSNSKRLSVIEAEGKIEGGMSGSPILSSDGKAIGVVCNGSPGQWNSQPILFKCLPSWILDIANRGSSGNDLSALEE